MVWKMPLLALALAWAAVPAAAATARSSCDAGCLEAIGQRYLDAYIKHDPKLAPISPKVRFTEINVDMPFPDGSWDAVTAEVAPALIFSDPATGGVGIYTGILMNDTPAFLTVRLKVVDGRITEIEHMLSTKRLVSGPPTPFGDPTRLKHDPEMARILAPSERRPRAELIRIADGYYKTLSRNDGTLHTTFSPKCHRLENGMETAADGCATGFKQGRFRFNERVRRSEILVDERRGLVMARGFIDHKGTVDHYRLTDGTERRSPFREPHSWSFIETFKISDGAITSVEADFVGSPYRSISPYGTERE
ncbi:MAG TPA: hypothetical protein VNZ43_01485 [Sphingomonadaceae bacterium]|nr:hypothetical protein [Sphingomonadaceae bacterium]